MATPTLATPTGTPVVLVDMDGVVADLEAQFWRHFTARHPEAPARVRDDAFYVADQLPHGWADAAHAVLDSPGFYRHLPPVPGAVDALRAMVRAGWDVLVCTSPSLTNPTCASDKLAWLAEHVGPDWPARAVICKDKGAVRGDLLVDDKPKISTRFAPTWTHVVFDRPYNRTTVGPRLTGWDRWADQLGAAFTQAAARGGTPLPAAGAAR